MNEGFFADVVVLVEGEDDRAAILGVAAARGHDFDAKGIAVIPCGGKTNIDRPLLIFSSFGIPTYVVWDSDESKKDGEAVNKRLLRILGAPEEPWPSSVAPNYTCFRDKLETTLESELGTDRYPAYIRAAQTALGISTSQAMKTPAAFTEIIRAAGEQGRTSATLDAAVTRIVALVPSLNG
jgi:predicted ATP-dependent endonuclease of OLD family